MLPSGIVGGRSVFYGNFKWSVLCYSSVSGAFRVILSMVCFVLIVFVVVLWLLVLALVLVLVLVILLMF